MNLLKSGFFLKIIIFQLISYSVIAQITPDEMIKNIGRGINLGNTLSAPYEGNWAPAVKESYFEDVASAGFKTVRIPIRFDKHTSFMEEVDYTDDDGNYTGSIDDYAVDSLFLIRIEQVVSWALDHDLIAIIDVHGDKWFWESYKSKSEFYKTGADRKAAEDRFKAIWRDISLRFKDYSENLLFEIMNEPYFAMNTEQVHNTNLAILDIIRVHNPTRIIIITGGGKNSWETPSTIKPDLLTSDKYLIATFHYYKPGEFTRSSREGFNDFDWGTDEDKAEVDIHFDYVKSWSVANNIPILLGEFGADNEGGYNYYKNKYGDFGGPTVESRENYHRYIADAAISRGFGFTVWDAGEKAGKTIYLASSRSWVEGVKNAVLGISTSAKTIIKYPDAVIYPNPCTDIIHIDSDQEIKAIHIYDQKGFPVKNQYNNNFKVDLTDLPTGFYYIAIYFNNNKIKTFKLLKEK